VSHATTVGCQGANVPDVSTSQFVERSTRGDRSIIAWHISNSRNRLERQAQWLDVTVDDAASGLASVRWLRSPTPTSSALRSSPGAARSSSDTEPTDRRSAVARSSLSTSQVEHRDLDDHLPRPTTTVSWVRLNRACSRVVEADDSGNLWAAGQAIGRCSSTKPIGHGLTVPRRHRRGRAVLARASCGRTGSVGPKPIAELRRRM